MSPTHAPLATPARSWSPRSAATGVLQRCGGRTCPPGTCDHKGNKLRRQPAGPGAGAVATGPAAAPPVVHQVLRSPGQPLDVGTQRFMASRLGHDFSQVRVHTDARAAESADAVGAHAYTVGSDVVFAAGRYAPATTGGQRLLAHELTHVVQQRGGGGSGNGGGLAAALEVGAVDTPQEREAATVASSIGQAGVATPGIRATGGPALRRQGGGGGGGGGGGAVASHRFAAEGVRVVVRPSCAAANFGFAAVEAAVRDALDRIFNDDCIHPDRARQIQRNLTRNGLDFRCRRTDPVAGPCAEATGFHIPANIITLGSAAFPGHPDRNEGCGPLASTVLHEIVHITRGFEGEQLPTSCEASCFGAGGATPDLCLSPIVVPPAGGGGGGP